MPTEELKMNCVNSNCQLLISSSKFDVPFALSGNISNILPKEFSEIAMKPKNNGLEKDDEEDREKIKDDNKKFSTSYFIRNRINDNNSYISNAPLPPDLPNMLHGLEISTDDFHLENLIKSLSFLTNHSKL